MLNAFAKGAPVNSFPGVTTSSYIFCKSKELMVDAGHVSISAKTQPFVACCSMQTHMLPTRLTLLTIKSSLFPMVLR